MKTAIAIFLALLFSMTALNTTAGAITWYPANSKTFAWDSVTLLVDGNPIPASDTVKYQVWIKKEGGVKMKYGDEVTTTQRTISLTEEGKYIVGVQAIRYVNGTERIVTTNAAGEELIAWSDNPEVLAANTDPFGIVFYVAAQTAKGLQPVK